MVQNQHYPPNFYHRPCPEEGFYDFPATLGRSRSLQSVLLDFSRSLHSNISQDSLINNSCQKLIDSDIRVIMQALQKLPSLQHLHMNFATYIISPEHPSHYFAKVLRHYRFWTASFESRPQKTSFVRNRLFEL